MTVKCESESSGKCQQEQLRLPAFGKRHVQGFLMFLCLMVEQGGRGTINVAIVSMTNQNETNPNIPTYDWDNSNIVLSSFTWGYLVLQVLAGQVGGSHGYKWLAFTAMAVNSLACLLIPLAAAYLGSYGVMGCRVVQGLAQGFFFPIAYLMLSKWAPEEERSRMMTFVYSGILVAGIITGPVTGYICASSVGWPVGFYVFGSVGLLWCLLWLFMGYDSPAVHPTISPQERKYIEESLGHHEAAEVVPTPWKAIFTSIHFWAIVVASIGTSYGATFLSTEMNQYLVKAMKFNVESSGVATAMPAVAAIVTTPFYGFISDLINKKKWLSRLNSRRLFQLYACYPQTIILIWMAFLTKSQGILAAALPVLSFSALGGIVFGLNVNILDLSSRFSGVTQGFANTLGSAFGLVAPLVVQYTVPHMDDPEEWRLPFLICAAAYGVSATFFAIFASGNKQWWDSGPIKITSDTEKV
ncbi:putative inorganic phosphate cotransporter [Cylas formicarius]|uniref:putative inorganic phosphate cotransporter n=1 Tax=Cylas formicarius TaxID=197179 RepID=UPI0029585392|nr:putative inorganic phosphate cotransporter [Cylas formicarius]